MPIRKVSMVFSLAILFAISLYILAFHHMVFLVVFAAMLFAIILHNFANALEHRFNLNHNLSLASVIGLITLIFGLVGWLYAPIFAEQAQEFFRQIPVALDHLANRFERYGWVQVLLGKTPSPEDLIAHTSAFISKTGVLFTGAGGAIGNVVIIVFLAIYLAAQPDLYIQGFIKLLPENKHKRAQKIIDTIGENLSRWLVGKAISMVIIGTVTTLGLMALGMPLALMLGIIAGLLDFIPYLGPLIAAVPAIMIALVEDPVLALYVALLFGGIQLLQGYFLEPFITRKAVTLPPALTIFMQVLLGSMFGLIGVALAIPFTVVLKVLIEMLYLKESFSEATTQ